MAHSLIEQEPSNGSSSSSFHWGFGLMLFVWPFDSAGLEVPELVKSDSSQL